MARAARTGPCGSRFASSSRKLSLSLTPEIIGAKAMPLPKLPTRMGDRVKIEDAPKAGVDAVTSEAAVQTDTPPPAAAKKAAKQAGSPTAAKTAAKSATKTATKTAAKTAAKKTAAKKAAAKQSAASKSTTPAKTAAKIAQQAPA